MTTGTVKWYDFERGYGFVGIDGSEKDAFIHYSNIQKGTDKMLKEGDRLQFELVDGPKGLQALKISKLS